MDRPRVSSLVAELTAARAAGNDTRVRQIEAELARRERDTAVERAVI